MVKEVHAAHILVKGQDQAQAILNDLKAQKKTFSQMAQEKSCTSAKIGEMEVLIIVIPISWLIVSRRL
jgi:parvulin-like peptidyl-prolyl isomerase